MGGPEWNGIGRAEGVEAGCVEGARGGKVPGSGREKGRAVKPGLAQGPCEGGQQSARRAQSVPP